MKVFGGIEARTVISEIIAIGAIEECCESFFFSKPDEVAVQLGFAEETPVGRILPVFRQVHFSCFYNLMTDTDLFGKSIRGFSLSQWDTWRVGGDSNNFSPSS